jgi:hypothetical protein
MLPLIAGAAALPAVTGAAGAGTAANADLLAKMSPKIAAALKGGAGAVGDAYTKYGLGDVNATYADTQDQARRAVEALPAAPAPLYEDPRAVAAANSIADLVRLYSAG